MRKIKHGISVGLVQMTVDAKYRFNGPTRLFSCYISLYDYEWSACFRIDINSDGEFIPVSVLRKQSSSLCPHECLQCIIIQMLVIRCRTYLTSSSTSKMCLKCQLRTRCKAVIYCTLDNWFDWEINRSFQQHFDAHELFWSYAKLAV